MAKELGWKIRVSFGQEEKPRKRRKLLSRKSEK